MVKPCISEPRAFKIPASLPLLVVTTGFCALVSSGLTDGVDEMMLLWLRHMVGDSGMLVSAAQAASRIGDWSDRIVVAVLAAYWLGKHGRQYALFALLLASIGVDYVTDEWLKQLFRRPRPDLVAHLTTAEGWSLPSGHAAGAMATFAFAAWLAAEPMQNRQAAKLVRGAGLLLAVLIGLSRPLLGVHWPTDVVAGWLVGATVAMVSLEICRYFATTAGAES